jgi:hypothetical protein
MLTRAAATAPRAPTSTCGAAQARAGLSAAYRLRPAEQCISTRRPPATAPSSAAATMLKHAVRFTSELSQIGARTYYRPETASRCQAICTTPADRPT